MTNNQSPSNNPKEYKIALLGNPNAGKTTLFNALTGMSARVGNYPGITVEMREAELKYEDLDNKVTIIDLPGTYSLLPRSDDESVTVQSLFSLTENLPSIDLVVAVVDVTHLNRNLYIIQQLVEAKVPMLIALSMTDTLEKDGLEVNTQLLEKRLKIPVIKSSGQRAVEVNILREKIADHIRSNEKSEKSNKGAFDFDVILNFYRQMIPRTERLQILEDLSKEKSKKAADGLIQIGHAQSELIENSKLHKIQQMYTEIEEMTSGVIFSGSSQDKILPQNHNSVDAASTLRSDRLDAAFLHPIFGPLLFLAIFTLLFQALFSWASPLMDLLSELIAFIGQHSLLLIPVSMPLMRSLWIDGIIGGVGNVIVFIPQIAILFFAITLLEDSGLLARVAFLLDRLMSKVGLHGRAFVPFLSGFACAIPAIMATRTIENERDRLTTILVTPLISCSARLPVYSLLIVTLFATMPPFLGFIPIASLILFSAYSLSLVTAILVAFVLKKTILKSPLPDFVLELPTFKRPNIKEAMRISIQKSGHFLKDAGTIIFAMSIILWGVFTFPQSEELKMKEAQEIQSLSNNDLAQKIEQEALLHQKYAALNLEYSLAGRLGKIIEPVIRPLGFDWKIGIGLLASFAAREVFVSSMGLVYGLGDGEDEESLPLKQQMLNAKHSDTLKAVYTPLSGLSLLVFFLLAMQCMSTLAATKRETNSYKWPIFQFVYMSVLAYVAALVVYQGGLALGYV